MYIAGEAEIEAIARVIRSGALFRYREDSECEKFETRYAAYLGAKDFMLSVSGTFGLYAGLIGLGIGPGDEVLVPAHTYMATATAVLSVGAIPVIVDIDESLTIDPAALRDAIGPRTRAVIPVHMWGAACNMNEIMEIAANRRLLVLEDACQAIGGAYEGRRLGSIGDAGAFSFNYFKNITAGEAGGLATSDPKFAERARAAIDPCNFYWQGRTDSIRPFAGVGARASEITGAMLNVQLDRLDPMIEAMRHEKKRILAGTNQVGNIGLAASPMNSPDEDCATQVMYLLPTEEAAQKFVQTIPAVIAGKTGRHNFTQWDQVLTHEGAHHPALNPYRLPENRGCRTEYPEGLGKRSLDIVNRTVMIATHPMHGDEEIADTIHNINAAARVVLENASLDDVSLRSVAPVDLGKYDGARTA
ncbi:MAG: aminotransferase class I/II-fold pyridoxal phosphate-dependent enzyme [Mesorhizobium sp.]|uniref:DegT/DnrJ/EryC1/StrS family aminotransferase n=1 Tax=Mesorhizobium sp. TaxID=1871066 RepID=UPI00122058E7|nr:aminotransferase class I/II-fold pyridoxal phosphate-dependent enzyme [Mesorhizobium sp.]TIN95517.1 MAG: aminotransferase class I/II-fold pyridoxal phosphate-dependent enzyme [Mesorhizobium sp.]TJU97164.1 MAG: aminotransferase class I/II-fold pyridoxal phosphate-dependent enzyme [Mesorhizobium sp.]